MAVYVDTCVYLNLWKRERGYFGRPHWRIAKEFFDHMYASGNVVVYSGMVLKELKHKAPQLYEQKRETFNDPSHFNRIIVMDSHYERARLLESESRFSISFFDCMHIVLAKASDAVLVTRDRKLLAFAKGRCVAVRPEELLQ
jgi:predicted nucleic acid-binding protein